MKDKLRLMESAVMNAGDAIFLTRAAEGDPFDFEIVFANAAFEQLTGYRFEEPEGKSPSILFGPKTDLQELEKIRRSIQQNRPCRSEVLNYRKDGSEFWAEICVVPLFDGDGIRTHILSIRRDITERKQAEEALRLSEERFRIAARNAGDLVVDYDLAADRATYFGSLARQFSFDGLPSTMDDWIRIIHPDDRDRVLTAFRTHFETRDLFCEEYRVTEAGGNTRYIAERGTALWNADGKPLRFVSVVTDVTERRRAENELSRLAAIVQYSADAIVSTTLDGTFLTWNDAAERLFGYSASEVVGCSVWMLVPPDRRRELGEMHQEVQRGGMILRHESVRLKKDGAQVPVVLSVSPIKDSSGNTIAVSVIYRDVSERKRWEAELEGSRQQLRNLAARIEAVREEERTRIAREIHDELGQVLLTLKLKIGTLFSQGHVESSQAGTSLIASLVDSAMNSVHKICSELRPSLLDDIGLKAAVEWQGREFEERTGITCRLDLQHITLGRDESTVVFRIFQELLANIARHSGATGVCVLLKASPKCVVLVVSDNGSGISESDIADAKSLGIVGMRERATMLGGAIEFKGVQGKGTTVALRIPRLD